MEKEKRNSAEELLSLSHSFNKTFCKVQKRNCIFISEPEKMKGARSRKVVTFMFIHKYSERTCLCLTPSFST